MRKVSLTQLILAALAGFLLIQVIPYGHNHSNPPVLQSPHWNNPQTQAFFDRACADCHSNQTVWPWYSNIAPVSWMVQHHVEEGRGELNLSELGRGKNEIDKMADALWKGRMPPKTYLPMHPKARLSESEKADFIHGLELTFSHFKGDK